MSSHHDVSTPTSPFHLCFERVPTILGMRTAMVKGPNVIATSASYDPRTTHPLIALVCNLYKARSLRMQQVPGPSCTPSMGLLPSFSRELQDASFINNAIQYE